MILRGVRVRNIRSYESGEVELPQGIIAFSGEIGAGKSSLLHAVEMALFGFAEVDAAHLLRHGATNGEVEAIFEDEGSTLSFRRSLTRTPRSGNDAAPKQDCTFARDGQRVRYSITEMKREASKLLGFPDDPNPRKQSELWKWAVYVRQEKMRDVLEEGGDRLGSIRKAHGLEEYKTSADNLDAVTAELRKRAESLSHDAEFLALQCAGLEEAKEKRKGVEEDLAKGRPEFDSLKREVESLKLQLEEKRELVSSCDRERVLLRQLADRSEGIQKSIRDKMAQKEGATQQARQFLKDAGALEKVIAAASVTDADVERRRGEYSVAKNAADQGRARKETFLRAKDRRDALQAKAQDLDKRSSRLRDSLRARWKDREALEKGLAEKPPEAPPGGSASLVDKELKSIGTLLEGANKTEALEDRRATDLRKLMESGKCPHCGQSVDRATFTLHLAEAERARTVAETETANLKRRKEELERLRKLHLEHDQALATWNHHRQTLDLRIQEMEREERELKDSETESGETSVALTHLEEEIATLGDPVKDHDELRKREEATAQVYEDTRNALETKRKLENEHALLREKVRSVEALAAGLGKDMGSLSADMAKLTDEGGKIRAGISRMEVEVKRFAGTEETLAKLEVKLEEKRALLTGLEKDAQNLQREISGLEDVRKKSGEASDKATRTASLIEWVRLFGGAVEKIERQRLDRIRVEFLEKFSRYYSMLVEDEGMRATMDGSFNPAVEIDGVPTPPSSLSGGERTALALSYRLALGYTVRSAQRLRLDTLVLDEPTEGFSAEQVTRLSELLRELGHRQILLVTHEGNLAGIADHVIRVEKRDGKSLILGQEAPGTSRLPTDQAHGRSAPPLD